MTPSRVRTGASGPIVFGIAAAAVVSALLSSCGTENSLGSLGERLHDTTTIYVTRHDTLYRDTLVVSEIKWAPRDTSAILYFGVVTDLTAFSTLAQPYDSAYVSVNTFSDPLRRDLAVSVNGTLLPHDPSYQAGMAYDGFFTNTDVFPLVQSVLYDKIVAASSAYAFSIVVPVYPADTSLPVAYDTVSAQAATPHMVDTIICFGPQGVCPAVTDTFGNRYIVVDNWENVRATWPDSADFYLVSVTKLTFDMFSNAYPVGELIDTVVADTQIVIPSSFLWMDDSTPADEQYYVAEIDVVPFTGPTPDQWDTLPSFESHGILFGLRAEYIYEILMPTRPDTTLARRPKTLAKRAGAARRCPRDLVNDVLGRLKN